MFKTPPLCPKCGHPMCCHGEHLRACPKLVSEAVALYVAEDVFHVDLVACCMQLDYVPDRAGQEKAHELVLKWIREVYPQIKDSCVDHTHPSRN